MSAGRRRLDGLGLVPMLAVTSLGLGLLRPAPGTWGSLPPALLVIALAWAGSDPWMAHACLALFLLLGSIACVRFGRAAEEASGATDPSSVVADETAGMALALLPVPWTALWPTPEAPGLGGAVLTCGAAFLLFRAFDIWKPGAIRGLQGRPHGWGILLDDLAAAAWCWPPLLVIAVAVRAL